MTFYPVKRVLYAADEQGYIHAFSLSAAFESVGICTVSNSWTNAVTGVGRTGSPPRETVMLQVAFSIRAHTDIVSGLLWVRGSNLLVTSSIDKRVMMWTLNLDFVGEFDPTVERGRFSVPVSVCEGDKYVTEPPQDEAILFLDAAQQLTSEPSRPLRGAASFRKVDSVRFFPSRRGNGDAAKATLTAAASADDGALGRTVSAAKFAEDVHRVAMELESFVPSKTQLLKSKKDANRIRSLGSTEPAGESLLYGKPCSSMPAAAEGGAHTVQGEGAEVSLSSSNSCGVYYRSLFSPVPLLSLKPKTHVVAEGGKDGGDGFVVTQDHPLPARFKLERDSILRDLVQQEQLQRQQQEEAKLVQSKIEPSHAQASVAVVREDETKFKSVQSVTRRDSEARRLTTISRQGRLPPGAGQVALAPRTNTPTVAALKPLLPCDLIRLHTSHLPQRAAHESLLLLRSATPQPKSTTLERFSDDSVDWTPPPRLSQHVQSCGSDDQASVGFCSFGVRSLQGVIHSGEKWRNTHRVDLTPLSEVPVSRPQSIASMRASNHY